MVYMGHDHDRGVSSFRILPSYGISSLPSDISTSNATFGHLSHVNRDRLRVARGDMARAALPTIWFEWRILH